jgi:hypothetical protein
LPFSCFSSHLLFSWFLSHLSSPMPRQSQSCGVCYLSVFISASVGTPGSMYELDGNGKYSDLCDFDATTRLHRSASLPVARAKADGNTTDNGDGEWDATPPELLPAVFSSRKKEHMKKKQKKRRATKGTPSATRLHLRQLLLPHLPPTRGRSEPVPSVSIMLLCRTTTISSR